MSSSSDKVSRDDFELRIDGRDWRYRNPDDYNMIQRYGRRNKGNKIIGGNPKANKMTNPLYEYSGGDVKDAAYALGISNVNKQGEVDSILEYIRNNPSKDKEESGLQTVPKYKKTEEHKNYKVKPSEAAKSAKAFTSAWNDNMMGSGSQLSENAVNPTAGMPSGTPQQDQASNTAISFKDRILQEGLQLQQVKDDYQTNMQNAPNKEKASNKDYFSHEKFAADVARAEQEEERKRNSAA